VKEETVSRTVVVDAFEAWASPRRTRRFLREPLARRAEAKRWHASG